MHVLLVSKDIFFLELNVYLHVQMEHIHNKMQGNAFLAVPLALLVMDHQDFIVLLVLALYILHCRQINAFQVAVHLSLSTTTNVFKNVLQVPFKTFCFIFVQPVYQIVHNVQTQFLVLNVQIIFIF